MFTRRERSTVPLFGDAVSATLVQNVSVPSDSYFSLHTDWVGSDHIVQSAGVFRKLMSVELADNINKHIDVEGNAVKINQEEQRSLTVLAALYS